MPAPRHRLAGSPGAPEESDEPRWAERLERYVAALAREDRAACVDVVEAALSGGADRAEVIDRLLAPAQREVGAAWARGTWTVPQEHAATAISTMVLEEVLAPQRDDPVTVDEGGLLLLCVEQEWHDFPAMLLAARLRARGLRVRHLGANTPVAALGRHVFEHRPRAVLLSCSLPSHLSVVRGGIEAVRAAGTPVVVGGSAFDADGLRATRLGATAYAADAESLLALLDGLPTVVPPAAPLVHPGAVEGLTLHAERERHAGAVVAALVRAGVLEPELAGDPGVARERALDAGPGEDWRAVLCEQTVHLIGCVSGALVADDPSVVSESWAWLEPVLTARGAPAGTVEQVQHALRHAVRDLPLAHALVPGPRMVRHAP